MMGNPPQKLASALYKLAYSSARIDRQALKQSEGLKAFFINDPSQALKEVRQLSQLDLDKSGSIDAAELAALKEKRVRLGFADHLLELLSTHPNMLKRVKMLSNMRP
jgi:heat shock protein HtpX